MKFLILSVCLVAYVSGFSQPIIRDTKTEGCIGEVCGPHCAWEDIKLFPGKSQNLPGKCQLGRCTDNFDIYLTPCPFDSEFY